MEAFETFTADTEAETVAPVVSTLAATPPTALNGNDLQQLALFKDITDTVQLEWLIEYVRTGRVLDTCETVGITHWRYLNWKNQAVFVKAFEASQSIRKGMMKQFTFETFYHGALYGFPVPIFNKNGEEIGVRQKPDTKLLMRAMETQHPDHRPQTRKTVSGSVDHRHAHLHAHMQQVETLPADEIDRLAEEGALSLYSTDD